MKLLFFTLILSACGGVPSSSSFKEAVGDLDTTFNETLGLGFVGSVDALKIQSDDRLLVAGRFTSFNGTDAQGVIRLESTGALDASFQSSGQFNDSVFALALQDDDKVLAGGVFTELAEISNGGLVRLNADGSVDGDFRVRLGTGFNGSVSTIAVQSDGKILVGGEFTTVNGTTSRSLVRLLASGSIDTDFLSGTGSGFDLGVNRVLVQSDGKILVGGSFTTFKGVSNYRLLQLKSDGTLDNDFSAQIDQGFNGAVRSLLNEVGGFLLVGGDFTVVDGSEAEYFSVLKSSGISSTTGLATLLPDYHVYDIAQQPNDSLLVSGQFAEVNGTTIGGLFRTSMAGELDTSFNTRLGSGFDGTVQAIAPTAKGPIYAGGEFYTVDGTTVGRLAKIK